MNTPTAQTADIDAHATGDDAGVRVDVPVIAVTPPTPAARRALRRDMPIVNPGKIDRIEMWVSRLSAKSRFWQRVCSLIWLPMAFRSGIRMKRVDSKTFTAVLPFRRFNRNWYNAMAGAALLANSEIAGGMYVFGVCGQDYECVCKRLEYRFLRPCHGPAVYKVTPRDDLESLVARGGEFNIDLVLDIVQQVHAPGSKEKRVGRCYATFHATPKMHKKAKRVRKRRAAKIATTQDHSLSR